ncbi:MAG: hypothetical protein M1331_00210 [Candidatus Marsarchaeota archaeon]|nr:hypothetical protein [Candidatus Marsarchaeota archaeon]MCL5105810.1 hypothetical protein [Candidatus Marsarchaeota archaeon]
MDSGISYETVWQILHKEKQTNELQLIPNTFYNDAERFIKNNIKSNATLNDANGSEFENKLNTKENIMFLLNKIFEKRKQKLLIYIAFNKPMPQPLPEIEMSFYNRLNELKKEFTLNIEEKAQGIFLKVVSDIPSILLPSGGKIGPLQKDQIINIKEKESEDINFLINNSICVKS